MEVDNYSTVNAVIYNDYPTRQAAKPEAGPTGTPVALERPEFDYQEPAPVIPDRSKGNQKPNERNQDRNPDDAINKAVRDANKKLAGTDRYLSYSVHKRTRDIMIKIIDSTTNEVIKEIPPEKNLDAVAKMWELVGILIDEKR